MNSFMKRAIELSIEKMKAGHGGPFGAVVVKDGEIIAEGYNCVRSINDPTAHAEVQAIRKACEKLKTFQLTGCEVYTSCEPCPMCLGALYWARPDRIYFGCTREDAAKVGFDDDFIYKEIQSPVNNRKIPTSQMGRDEALSAFKAWQEKEDKAPY